MSIYFRQIALHIFGGAETGCFFHGGGAHVADCKGFIEAHTVDDASLIDDPLGQQGKHPSGGTLIQYFLVLIAQGINIRYGILSGKIFFHRTDFMAKIAVNTFLLIYLRV